MASILSLLIGQIGVFIWFRYLLEPSTDTIWHLWLGEGFFQWFDAWLKPSGINDGWYAASFPCLVFLLLAVPVAASSFRLPRYAPGGGRPFSWSLFYEHFHQLGKLWKNRNLRGSRADGLDERGNGAGGHSRLRDLPPPHPDECFRGGRRADGG